MEAMAQASDAGLSQAVLTRKCMDALFVRATAIILAGGNSTRMGQDKSMMPYRGQPMIQHICFRLFLDFPQVIVSANDREKYAFLKTEIVPDINLDLRRCESPIKECLRHCEESPTKQSPRSLGGEEIAPSEDSPRPRSAGPLVGIVSALEHSASDYNFVIACDSPRIDTVFINTMFHLAEGYDCVIPIDQTGKLQPLFAVYRKSALKAAWSVLDSGQRKITKMYSRCRTLYVNLPRTFNPVNINTIENYRNMVSHANGGRSPLPETTASTVHCCNVQAG